ncbi:signal transduction histidine kinase [Roseimicrobium gellanilyticum]|uniref:histidine kinase n=1 Tax=Roseimicrobium gellanilyticum TaxID=748857 RepID=A0A366H452_9BACT|nr:HAMP domain-containing sensor histidine kinase [Roseimicrobium gellanilyticum]RBP36645.1 signal transduction histidine kinase [Roseimicrobium gellanilyticum]
MNGGPMDDELRRLALGALEAVVLVREGKTGEFRLLDTPPLWWEIAFGSEQEFRERSLFLEDFTSGIGAEFWDRGVGESLRSGIWEETIANARRFFEAIAIRGVGSEDLLMILPADERWREEQTFVQSSHDQSLNRRRLMKDLEKRQVLLECIMHDLGNPATTVLMNLQHINRHLGEGHGGLRSSVQRIMVQAERQRKLIRVIAEAFATDLDSAGDLDGPDAPDLVAVGAETAAALAAQAAEAGVSLCPFFGPSLPVAAEKLTLSRVIENLLVNAIRHSKEGGTVGIYFEKEGRMGVCRVEDQGTGIETHLQERLFQPFVQGSKNAGQSGLGLYFCRLSVEKWGGSIHAWNRKGDRGACFEFRIPLAGKETS